MGSYSYLVKKSKKEMFELGKGSWSSDLLKYEVKIKEPILENDYLADGVLVFKFNTINDVYSLIKIVCADWNVDAVYKKQLIHKIWNFTDIEPVYLVNDADDLYIELKRDHGYKCLIGRYE